MLRFEGLVYVDAGTSDFKILERVRQETQSIFPGLRRSRIMVSRRDVRGPSVDDFRQEAVTVVGPGDARRPALRIRFRYAARPDVYPDLEAREEIPLAALHRTQDVDPERVLRECAPKAPADRDYSGSLALVFDPTEGSCKAAIQAEQAAIDAARAKLASQAGTGSPPSSTEVPVEEVDRIYLPVTIVLEPTAAATQATASFPLYEPFDPVVAARRAQVEAEDPGKRPAAVIVDPDPNRPSDEGDSRAPDERASPARRPAGEQKPVAEKGVPELVEGPGAAQPAPPAQKKDGFFDRFELPLDTLLDPRFLAVWASFLMVIPILRADRKRRR